MTSLTRIRRIALPTLMLFTIALGSHSVAGDRQGTNEQLPKGDWSLSAHPYMGKGYDSRPVMVSSVSMDKTPVVTKVGLWNISNKVVLGVKLGWSLTTDENRGAVLRQGETVLIAISGGLPVNDSQSLKFPVVAFRDIYKPLLKNGALDGHYRIEVLVTEILFEDGTTWTPESNKIKKIAFVNAVFHPGATLPLAITPFRPTVQPCPKQHCVFTAGPPDYYSCGSSQNGEYCTNCVSSCCNTLCGVPPQCDCN